MIGGHAGRGIAFDVLDRLEAFAGGQRQIVRWILEQRILGDGNFMKQDVGMIGIQTDGLLISDKVNFMSSGREFNAQLRTNHTAAAVGITAWWQLQHQHAYAPLVTRIVLENTYEVPTGPDFPAGN